jgi:hypothetical protein
MCLATLAMTAMITIAVIVKSTAEVVVANMSASIDTATIRAATADF